MIVGEVWRREDGGVEVVNGRYTCRGGGASGGPYASVVTLPGKTEYLFRCTIPTLGNKL